MQTLNRHLIRSSDAVDLKLPANFYPETVRQVVNCVGPENGTPAYDAAIDLLTRGLKLNWDPLLKSTLKGLLNRLCETPRFGDSILISPEHGENPAIHSLHSVLVGYEILRRSGVTHNKKSPDFINGFMQKFALSVIIHDCGEIFTEFNTVEGRAGNISKQENAQLEQLVFQSVLKVNLQAQQAGREDLYYRDFAGLKKKFMTAYQAGADFQGLQKLLDDSVKGIKLKGEFLDCYRQLTAAYVRAELKEEAQLTAEDKFIGCFVKLCEHIQGSRHFLRYVIPPKGVDYQPYFDTSSKASRVRPATKYDDMLLPADKSDSHLAIYQMKYLEGEVGKLFSLINDCQAEFRPILLEIARVARNSVFETQMEKINYGPQFVLRSSTVRVRRIALREKEFKAESDPRLKSYIRKLLIAEHALQQKKLKQARAAERKIKGPDFFGEVVSKSEMLALYQAAKKIDYRPKSGEVLLLLPAEEVKRILQEAAA